MRGVDWDSHFEGKIAIEQASLRHQVILVAVTLALALGAAIAAMVLLMRGSETHLKDLVAWGSSVAFGAMNVKFITDVRDARLRIKDLGTAKVVTRDLFERDPDSLAELSVSMVKKGIL